MVMSGAGTAHVGGVIGGFGRGDVVEGLGLGLLGEAELAARLVSVRLYVARERRVMVRIVQDALGVAGVLQRHRILRDRGIEIGKEFVQSHKEIEGVDDEIQRLQLIESIQGRGHRGRRHAGGVMGVLRFHADGIAIHVGVLSKSSAGAGKTLSRLNCRSSRVD